MKINTPRIFKKTGFKIKQHSPEILITVGIIGTVTSTIMACKSTLKINDILEKEKAELETIHERADEFIEDENVPYTARDKRNDLIGCYGRISIKIIKLYAPSVILGTLSIASIIGSHRILKKRNIAIGSAFALTDKAFKEYRERVKDKIGEKKEHELFFNIKEDTVEEEVTLKNGNKKMRKKKERTYSDVPSPFTAFFDSKNLNWVDDPEHNLIYINNVWRAMNKQLEYDGYLFLNDVRSALGFGKTKAGQVTGWLYDPKITNKVSFGLDDVNNGYIRDFVNGLESFVPLEFNVDGEILSSLFDSKTLEGMGLEVD